MMLFTFLKLCAVVMQAVQLPKHSKMHAVCSVSETRENDRTEYGIGIARDCRCDVHTPMNKMEGGVTFICCGLWSLVTM